MNKTQVGSDDDSVPLPSPKVFSKIKIATRKITSKFILYRKHRGDIKKDHESPVRNIYNFLGQRPFWGYHTFLIALVIFIGSANALAKAKIENDILYNPSIQPVESKADFTADVGHYTSTIQEDPASIVLASAINDTSGYYSEPLITDTQITEKPKPAEPQEDLRNRNHTITYIVQGGDTLTSIGWKYGLKVATIKYQNDLKGETIRPGQKLTLPPGDISSSLIAKANQNPSSQDNNRISSYDTNDEGWVRPIGGTITRRIEYGHTGTDISASGGTPIVAAKSGVVVGAAYGWNGGYGNIVTIDHGGGVKTRYAHLSSIGVSVGQSVGGGQYVGACGNTGRVFGASGGYHLHFEAIVGGRFTAPF